MTRFYGCGSTVLRLQEPLREDNLLFITKSPGVPGTHYIDLEEMQA